MPDYTPPAEYRGAPQRFVLPAGSTMWRVHRQQRAATEFVKSKGKPPGGRFDDEPCQVWYGALDSGTAVAEVVLQSGATLVRRKAIAGLRASVVVTATDLAVVDLRTGPALAAAAQDGWLVTAEGREFPMTRRWGGWIRTHAPWAQGFVWATRGSDRHASVVLFGDRCDSTVLTPEPRYEVNLDDDFGTRWLNGQLVDYGAKVMPPNRK
jgi:hypothetical protein